MTDLKAPHRNRRRALQEITAVGALGGMAMNLFPRAYAQGINGGVLSNQGDMTLISGVKTASIAMAEWEPPKVAGVAEGTGGLRVAQGDEPVSKAPANASRYTAKSFDFPGGALRVLTWKKGGPVMHQITFETVIMVLEGSVTLAPNKEFPGPTATLKRGDALYLPSGTLRNMKPVGDTVLLQAFVASASAHPKRSIVLAKDAKETPVKDDAARYTVKRYDFDGNSIRVAKFSKGGKTNEARASRSDVIIYVTKGRLRRTEGGKTFESVAGDAVRETHNVPGNWEGLEDSEFVAMDAPLLPGMYAPGMVATGGGIKFFAMDNDENGRSRLAYANVVMKTVSGTEAFSDKHPGIAWRLGPRAQITPYVRTHKSYTSNAGPYENHTGGPPHITVCMAGHAEATFQDGSVLRRGAGEVTYVTPGPQHHANFPSLVPSIYLNLSLPGTDMDTKLPTF